MNISGLLHFLNKLPEFNRLVARVIQNKSCHLSVTVIEAARAYLIAGLAEALHVPLVVIRSHPENAAKTYEEIQTWCSDLVQPYYYPEHEFLGGEFIYDEAAMAQRLQTLAALAECDVRTNMVSLPLIVCSAGAAASITIEKEYFKDKCRTLSTGSSADPISLISEWQEIGYKMEEVVEVPGTMARRGGIIDIFSPNQDKPVRIEFFGVEIESIRYFDAESQRSLDQSQSVTIVPAQENFTRSNRGTILDHIGNNVLVISDETNELEDVITRILAQYSEHAVHYTLSEEKKQPNPNPYLSWTEFLDRLENVKKRISIGHTTLNDITDYSVEVFPFVVPDSYGGRFKLFIETTAELKKAECLLTIVSQQTSRLKELFLEQNIPSRIVENLAELPFPGTVTLVHGSLNDGFSIRSDLIVFTDREIFGFVKQRRLLKRRPARRYKYASELSEGDYVVHVDHGIGRYKGLGMREVDGAVREFITLEYAAGDRLFVPVEQIDRVGHYVGGTDQPPRLSRLHTQEWNNAKQRVKKSVVEIAEELVKIYASRELMKGFSFSADNIWQQELESSFPYVETPDQMQAVISVKEDMENEQPMDRLVCGDVGYGKTEVALRAAFKAVLDNKQVALLVPTTVLAQQHFHTFSERLQAFPVRVEVLSRLTTDKEQKIILDDLNKGAVDICIGTHRLLQKDVVFKDLGLLIIDEEQRFGVIHKDYFKKLRNAVDILTLSATPIPRTLHMALTGIRDLSTMDTPPEERLPIKTYVGIYDSKMVREAILRELERDGQVFFVHNRVHNILSIAAELRDLVPEARISVAHGQMPDELEGVMSEFVQHKSDILLTTTIIESGLDMPNVNTLIVNDADKLGLTQLYQLRGRIGRGAHTAYAYFFYLRGKKLTGQARKRLATIAETTELGAGFKIAMKDLEIRGAGNLLGVDQSGNISIVGFDLYCSLLAEAVEEQRNVMKGTDQIVPPVLPRPSILLPLDAYIPENYISDENIRLSYYRRLAVPPNMSVVESIHADLRDRFGVLPPEVHDLLYAAGIRILAARSVVEQITTRGDLIVIYFYINLSSLSNEDNRISVLHRKGITIGRKQMKLDISELGNSWKNVLEQILQAFHKNSTDDYSR